MKHTIVSSELPVFTLLPNIGHRFTTERNPMQQNDGVSNFLYSVGLGF